MDLLFLKIMKIVVDKFFLLLVFVLGALRGIAADGPPAPNPLGRKKPPSPPGFPIDENSMILVAFALLFGIYIIYKHRLKTKTPI